MSEAALRIRRRLKDDFAFYSQHCLKIRDKNSQIIPFVLNEAQQILHDVCERQLKETGMIRVVILKGRQQGLSTYVGGRLYHGVSQTKAKKAAVVTHHADSTSTLFDMTKRYHKNCPEHVRPNTTRSSSKELLFDRLDSAYRVATAGGDGILRGETLTDLHASEIAFWRTSSARTNWNGLRQAIPDAPGTAIFIESTANGVGNLFYELWQGAVKGENDYEAVFIPWFKSSEYRRTPSEGFERTPDEEELVALYGLDDSQLAWRRKKVADNGLDLFRQEYPCCPEEAFLTSGRPAFVPEKVQERMREISAPTQRLALEGENWREHSRGELWVYRQPDPGESYVIGGDTASGIKGPRRPNGEYEGDYSVLQVLDRQKRQCAVWRGHVMPDFFAEVAAALGEYYNWAHIAIEANNHGILTNWRLQNDFHYPDLYTWVQKDKRTDKETEKLGFETTTKTRPMVVNELRGAWRSDEITLNDMQTLREMQVFVENEAGKFEAEPGNHDDTVMALAIANHVHVGAWDPVPMEDDYYVEAI